ncbi:MAG TPA: hypothetical protein PKD31_21825, partial [Blastocatellia bacterium]|nr:hypothetical protein [Blastocatellia bacterium]
MSRLKSILRNLRLILSREITDQIGEVETRLSRRADDYEHAVDARLDERFNALHQLIGERFAELQQHLDQRAGNYESALDRRVEERLIGVEKHLDERVDNVERRMDDRFDEKVRAVDSRLDDRFVKIELQIDERFNVLDTRVDERMQRHERKVDAMIRQFSLDIVERNDVMLQLFEQRLDKQRRELREIKAAKVSADGGQTESAVEKEDPADDAQRQLISFRKLANVTTNLQTKIQASAETPLYHQILDWKKIAHEGLNDFSPDEQETADYILSFLDD